MFGRVAGILATCFVATGILIFSIFHSASVRYTFGQSPTPTPPVEEADLAVDYPLPYPGRVLPDHLLWPVKVVRDRLWLAMTTNPLKKAEISLLLANKRLASSQALFEEEKPDIAISTLTKAEKYLEKSYFYQEQARKKGMETGDFLEKLNIAALKHQEVIAKIILIAPEDARGILEKTAVYAQSLYRDTKNALVSLGRGFSKNPFE